MIVYNVTTKVDNSIVAAWLQWMQEEHIPALLATGCFTDARLLHLFESDDEEGITYAAQYHAASLEAYEQYLEKFAPDLRKATMEKWGNKLIAFRSVMKVVH